MNNEAIEEMINKQNKKSFFNKNKALILLLLGMVIGAFVFYEYQNFNKNYILINEAKRQCSIVINQTQNYLVEQCKAYIDNLIKQGG